MTGLVFAAVAPHGYLAVDEAVPEAEQHLGQSTRAAMAELGRRFSAAAPDTVILLTPHHLHVEGAFAVIQSGWLAGNLDDWTSRPVSLRVPVDREVSRTLLQTLRSDGVSAVGVSYGGNDQAGATAPLDWGSLIPLWFMGGRSDPQVPVVLVCPARDLPVEDHLRVGAAIAQTAAYSGKRVALIASADHGHGHLASGPYGLTPESALYDRQVMSLIESGNLAGLLNLPGQLVSAALADSYWQLLMLHGALSATGQNWEPELLCYEVPTYFGMACASFQVAQHSSSPVVATGE